MNNTIVLFNNVSKKYRLTPFSTKTAVSNLSFSLKKGKALALVGPNGSGKSTTLKLITGLLHPTQGTIRLFNLPPYHPKSRQKIGYLPENPNVFPFLTPYQSLNLLASLSSYPPTPQTIQKILTLVGLEKVQHSKAANFSKGMMQRLAIAQTLIHNPQLLLLDEPTSGLDPSAQLNLRQLIQTIKKQIPHLTLILTTHRLEEAYWLTDSILYLENGKKLYYTPTSSKYQQFEIWIGQKNNPQKLTLHSITQLIQTLQTLEQKQTPIHYLSTSYLPQPKKGEINQ